MLTIILLIYESICELFCLYPRQKTFNVLRVFYLQIPNLASSVISTVKNGLIGYPNYVKDSFKIVQKKVSVFFLIRCHVYPSVS